MKHSPPSRNDKFAVVEIVLITRTYALYGASNRPLLAFLIFLFVAQMVLMGVSMHFTHSVSFSFLFLTAPITVLFWFSAGGTAGTDRYGFHRVAFVTSET